MPEDWIKVCATDAIEPEDVMRFDHGDRTFAIYRTADNRYFATDGLCTHEKVHLADGFVIGTVIECPKHNGHFDLRTGAATRRPCRVPLATHPVKVEQGHVFLHLG